MPQDQALDAPSAMTRTPARKTSSDSSGEGRSTDGREPARRAHFVLQGKGGVGKSFVASLLAQYLVEHDRLDGCYDTDPVNRSLRSVPALQAQPVELLNRNALNVKAVDRLVEVIAAGRLDVVVDGGAASFLPLSRYLVEGGIAGTLLEQGVRMVVHTIVTGGGNGLDTLRGMEAAIEHFTPEAHVTCWANEYFGPIAFDGVPFEKTEAYRSMRPKMHGIIFLHRLDPELFEPNLREMLERHMTFAQALASEDFMLMEKSRLTRIRHEIWEQLAEIV